MSRKRCDERGIAAIEFALVAPFVLLLLIGMVSTGFTYSDKLSIANAVREGSRYGAAVDYSASSWNTSVRDRVKDTYQNHGSSLTNAEICVKVINSSGTAISGTSWTGASCGTAPSAPSNMVSGTCAVMVWVKKPATIQLVVAPTLHFDIDAKSIAYYGRTVGTTCASS